MRIVFMGTPDFAVPTLDALVEAGHEVVAVYTPAAAARRARGKALIALAGAGARRGAGDRGAHAASRCAMPEEQAAFAALDADVAVVAAYGLILPQPVLDAPRHGCLNVHASLLPRWRGAAPIQRAILAGDAETGVDDHADGGGARYRARCCCEARTPIDGKTAGELTERTGAMGAAADGRGAGRSRRAIRRVPQPEDGVTYAAKIDKAEARLDFGADRRSRSSGRCARSTRRRARGSK